MTNRGIKADVGTGTIIAGRRKSLDVTETSTRRTIPVDGKMMVDVKKGWPHGGQNVNVHETNLARIMLWRHPIDAGLPQMIVTDDTNALLLVSGSLDNLGMRVRRKRIARIGSERRKRSRHGWIHTSPLILRLEFLVDKYLAENSTASRRGKKGSKTKKWGIIVLLPMIKILSDSPHLLHFLNRPRKQWTKFNYSSSWWKGRKRRRKQKTIPILFRMELHQCFSNTTSVPSLINEVFERC